MARYGVDEECEVVSESDIDSDLSDDLEDVDIDECALARTNEATTRGDKVAVGVGDESKTEQLPPSQSQLVGLVARLRWENLQMRETLVQAQREAENATVALASEREENGRLLLELEQLRGLSKSLEIQDRPRTALATVPGEPPNKGEEEISFSSEQGRQNSLQGIVRRVLELKQEAQRERDQRLGLEKELVRSKVKCKEVSDHAEALEDFIHSNHEVVHGLRVAVSSSEITRSVSKSSDLSVDSSPMPKKKGIHKLVGRMLGAGGGGARPELAAVTGTPGPGRGGVSPTTSTEDLDSQREVLNALMSELNRLRKKAHKYKANNMKNKEDRPRLSSAIAQ